MTEGGEVRARQFIVRADEAIRRAQEMLAEGDIDLAVNRTYYGAFYAAQALLETRGLQTNRHSTLIGLFGREFVKTGLMDGSHGRALGALLQLRLEADYQPAPDIDEPQVRDFLHQATAFVADARALLDELLGSG